ncbi:MAG: cache domain-containing protein [Pseudomonadota bacterium]
MLHIARFCTFLCAVLVLAPTASAAERGTADEAIALVHKAGDYLKANGKDKLIAEVNNPQGQFRDRDLYISVSDMKGLNLAHAVNPKLVGKDLIDLRDGEGKYFVRERLEGLKKQNSVWVNYIFVNPTNKQLEHKSMYTERYGDIAISCGIYKP